MHELARRQVQRVKQACVQAGFETMPIPAIVPGAGFAIRWNLSEVVVASVTVGAPDRVRLTSGVLRRVRPPRILLLEFTNRFTRQDSANPIYLYDSPGEYSLLCQQTHPIDLLLGVSGELKPRIDLLAEASLLCRLTIDEDSSILGDHWGTSESELRELLLYSVM